MKTLALLRNVALVLAGVTTSEAQVYSVNAVGYVNVNLPRGFSMVGNQLDAGSGNNVVSKLFAPANLSATPTGCRIYVFHNSTGVYSTATFSSLTSAWGGAGAAAVILPGDGVFFQNLTSADLTCTFIGEIMQGTFSTTIPQGFSIRCNPLPMPLDPDAPSLPPSDRLPGAPGDRVYRFNKATLAYATYQFSSLTGGFNPSLPTFDIGEAFFVQRLNPPTSWIRTFSVNG
jgi:hypothetical protein